MLYVKWIKDTMMKSTILGNINPEVKEGMEFNLNEMKKVLKLMSSMEKGE